MGKCCHFCYDPVCTDRLEKDGFHLPESEGKDGIRLFAVVATSRKSAGHDPYFAKRWTGVSSGIPSGKGII